MQSYDHAYSLKLIATGTEFTNFDRYTVTIDMLDLGNPFTFSLWRSNITNTLWSDVVSSIKLGAKIAFDIDGITQLTGLIESINITSNRGSGTALVISGRDLTGPAISWDISPAIRVRDRTLQQVLTDAFATIGLPISIGHNAEIERNTRTGRNRNTRALTLRPRTNNIRRAKPRHGEKIMDFALSVIRRLGFMCWVAPTHDGTLALIVDVPDYTSDDVFRFERRLVNGVVTQQSNILDSTYTAQIRSIPTVVTAYSRVNRGNTAPSFNRERAVQFATATNAQYGVAIDTIPGEPVVAVTRVPFTNTALLQYPFIEQPLVKQTLHLTSDRAKDAAHGAQEAKKTIADAMKNFRNYTLTVKGHGQIINSQRLLYAVNTMAAVRDDITGINESMLITSVEFSGSRKDGKTTRLVLGTKGAIQLQPESS